MKDNTVTDYDIQALVDEELSRDQVRKILHLIENNPAARRRYQELLDQKDLLKFWSESYLH